jgi:hypothetical protein
MATSWTSVALHISMRGTRTTHDNLPCFCGPQKIQKWDMIGARHAPGPIQPTSCQGRDNGGLFLVCLPVHHISIYFASRSLVSSKTHLDSPSIGS